MYPNPTKRRRLSTNEELFLILRSADGKDRQIPLDAAKQSKTLRNMIESVGNENTGQDHYNAPIIMNQTDSNTLKLVVDYCIKHRADVVVERDETDGYKDKQVHVEIGQDDLKYVNLDSDGLFNILEAANFLEIQGLLDIITQKIANLAAGKSVMEMRELFMIENDLMPSQEERIRLRHEWHPNPLFRGN